ALISSSISGPRSSFSMALHGEFVPVTGGAILPAAPEPAHLVLPITRFSRGTMQRPTAIVLFALLTASGCSQYRLAGIEEVEIPSYEPRPVPLPASCDSLITRIAAVGMERVSELESREALFCQQQM